ncbi:MAG: hypothetical protein HYU97_00010 [Deltaproteobacteria bacterium]|nr:hypothetical protein [Deltaproteobacteria bacterium]
MLSPFKNLHAEIALVDSLEWITLDAELIVRGKVKKNSPAKSNSIQSRNSKFSPVHFQVFETLKGNVVSEIQFEAGYLKEVLEKWGSEGSDVLVFLKQIDFQKSASGKVWAVRSGEFPNAINLDWLKTRPEIHFNIFNTAMQAIKNREQVIQLVKDTLVQWKDIKSIQRASVDVPYKTELFKRYYSGSSVYLIVPLSPQLQKSCKEWRQLNDLRHCEKL